MTSPETQRKFWLGLSPFNIFQALDLLLGHNNSNKAFFRSANNSVFLQANASINFGFLLFDRKDNL